ncbi:MAG: hypothetical protein ABIK78_01080 [candidate division WOR-3 bacterium]
MKKILLGLVTISIIIISCKKEKKVTDIMPLNLGNYWNYQRLVVEDGDTTLSDTFKMEVNTQNKDTFYLIGSLFTFEELPEKPEEESMKVIFYDSLLFTYTDDEPDTQLVLPLKEGKSWKVNEEFTAEVISIEGVNIGDKQYSDCWRIKYQNEDGDIQKELWFKEEIGIVKFRKEEDGEITILELKEYNLNR